MAMREAMAHRGPDGAGVWRVGAGASLTAGQVVLAHRRLIVVDPTPGGAQPFVDVAGRGALTYNGELYNDVEVRAELAELGWTFRTRSDTETVLAALVQWGAAGLAKLRGMYAIGFCDLARGTLLIARDPLGVKPLYWWMEEAKAGRPAHLAFASEIPALLKHPLVDVRPDFVAVNAYLSTIRTTLGRRTLFEGVRAMLPGEAIEFDLKREDLAAKRFECSGMTARGTMESCGDEEAAITVRKAVEDSVTRHLRADVPTCSLLSGGLDSSIIAALAVRSDPGLSTFCSGARAQATTQDDDFAFAAKMAKRLATDHHEAPVTREIFRTRWPEMVEATGLPLSTPNEVAINEVARLLRSHGKVVALSGEGADELFAGYALPMAAAHAMAAAGNEDPALAIIEEASWVPPSAKGAVLREASWGEDADGHLVEWYRSEFAALTQACPGEPLEAHLRLMRRTNLDGLLRRLDSATMLAGVEGRTPFADREVAALAGALPMRQKFRFEASGKHGTKVALRAAFADLLPEEVVARAKASFPLPFQDWMADQVGRLTTSVFARELFSEGAIAAVARKPDQAWRFAWPLINIAMWGTRWWG